MKYCMDTSSFLEGSIDRPYEMGINYFNPIWEKIDDKIMNGTIISPYLVLKELEKKEDAVYNWAKARADILFKKPNKEVQIIAGEIVDTFPEIVPKNKPYWADAEVVALAKVENRVVITQEEFIINPKPKNRKIPNICEHFGVDYTKMVGVLK